VILCFRAAPKVEMKRNAKGEMEVVPKQTIPGRGLDGWIPESDPALPFEMTCSFLLMADAPGVPKPIKLPERLRAFVPLDAPLTEKVGADLATWAAGTETPAPADTLPNSPGNVEEAGPLQSGAGAHNLATALSKVWEAIPISKRPSMEQLAAKVERERPESSFESLLEELSQPEAERLHVALSDYQRKLSTGGESDA